MTAIGGALYDTTEVAGADGDGMEFSVPVLEPVTSRLLLAALLGALGGFRRR